MTTETAQDPVLARPEGATGAPLGADAGAPSTEAG